MFGQKPIHVDWMPGITNYDPARYTPDNPPTRAMAYAMLIGVYLTRGRESEQDLQRSALKPECRSARQELMRRQQLEK